MTALRTFLLAWLVATFAGCASVNVDDYRNQKPTLDLAQYFNGTIDGWGMFQDRSGKVLRRFHVTVDAKWVGSEGTLHEHFEFTDGTREQRIWKIAKDGDRYKGTAGDVVGVAQGTSAGNALRWTYVLALPVDGATWHMDMDDWMVMIDDKTILNRTTMSKFGIEVGQVTLSFTKR